MRLLLVLVTLQALSVLLLVSSCVSVGVSYCMRSVLVCCVCLPSCLVVLRSLSLMGTCVSMCVERLVHLWLLVPCLFLLLFPTCFFYVLSTVLLTCMLCVPSSYWYYARGLPDRLTHPGSPSSHLHFSLRPSVFCLLLPLSYASLFLRSFSLFLLVLLLMLLFLLLLLLTHVEVVALIVTLLLVLIGGCASVFLLPS